jgi:hypothetical protein
MSTLTGPFKAMDVRPGDHVLACTERDGVEREFLIPGKKIVELTRFRDKFDGPITHIRFVGSDGFYVEVMPDSEIRIARTDADPILDFLGHHPPGARGKTT